MTARTPFGQGELIVSIDLQDDGRHIGRVDFFPTGLGDARRRVTAPYRTSDAAYWAARAIVDDVFTRAEDRGPFAHLRRPARPGAVESLWSVALRLR